MNSRWGAVAAALCAMTVSACGGGAGSGDGAKAAVAPNAAVKIPLEVWDFTLPNGMRVILDEDKSAPVVAVNVWYKVGSKDDPPGRGGFAHLFEHLMFQGTHSLEGDVSSAMFRAGASTFQATTNLDRTEYHETIDPNSLEWFLWFEAERMATMGERLDQQALDRERRVVKNELRQRYENRDAGFARNVALRALFGKQHPYGHAPIGTIEELDAASLAEVRAFHDRYYQPSSAVLSLVGDFDHKRASALIAKYFAPLPNNPAPVVRRAPTSPPAAEKRIVLEANIALPLVLVVYAAPPAGAPELPALSAMSGHITGDLDYYLIEQRKIARWVSWSLDQGMLASMLSFKVQLARGEDADEALRVLDKSIFDDAPNTFGNFNSSFNHLKLARLFNYEDFEDRAEMYAHYDDLTGNPLGVARELEAIQRAGRADVFNARARFLQTHGRVVIVVRTNAGAPVGGRVVQGDLG